MQTASSWIWTLVTNFISYRDNYYAKHSTVDVKGVER